MSNLVELMAKACELRYIDRNMTYCPDRSKVVPTVDMLKDAECMLSVVKEHIGEVARVCPRCDGGRLIFFDKCPLCLGVKIIARTEGDV